MKYRYFKAWFLKVECSICWNLVHRWSLVAHAKWHMQQDTEYGELTPMHATHRDITISKEDPTLMKDTGWVTSDPGLD